MKIKDLIPSDEYVTYESDFLDLEITLCSCNYKKADSQTLLFLLPGVNFDTYELIHEYIKSSPKAIITENIKKFPKTKIPIIEVKNSRRAFAYAMSNISEINYEKLTFIGVTGTNGKTSTSTMIKKILEHNKKRCGFIGTGKLEFENQNYASMNYSMTCPDPDVLYPTIKNMQNNGAEIIVIEASSHALELEKLSPIKFKIGIFTGLSHDHLEFHGSMENYFMAKEKLIKTADRAIINFDDPWGKKLYEKYKDKSTGIGVVWRSDVFATEVENYGLCGIGYIYRGKNFLTRIKLPLPGLHNIYNSMMAFEAAYIMNISPIDIRQALEGIESIEGRCECIHDDITVIIDYAHTPLALENILKTAKSSKTFGQKIILVFGCGGDRDPSKRPLMAKAAEKYADKIIITTDNPRGENEEKILSDIVSGFEKKDYGVIKDRTLAIAYAIKSAFPNDIVIIAGKGHEKYICDKNGYHFFDEKSIIQAALKLRKQED